MRQRATEGRSIRAEAPFRREAARRLRRGSKTFQGTGHDEAGKEEGVRAAAVVLFSLGTPEVKGKERRGEKRKKGSRDTKGRKRACRKMERLPRDSLCVIHDRPQRHRKDFYCSPERLNDARRCCVSRLVDGILAPAAFCL